MIHGPAALESTVAVIAQAWNWSLKQLSRRKLADEVAQMVFHADVNPYRSTLSLRVGTKQVGGAVPVGTATDEEAWKRAAWRLAVQLVSEVTQQHGQDWKAPADILQKAF